MVDLKKIQEKWQKKWVKEDVFKTSLDSKKEKYYVLEMFPYPSGYLHMGHVRNYSIGDAFARYKRMQGFNVLYPMGYDAFGLPAENAAIKKGVDPAKWTDENIQGIKDQQKMLGLSYDWDREVATCKPNYYKWTQWIFLKFFEKDLAYKKKAVVNWCPKCGTVLANEQVHEGKCWRCDSDVDQKQLSQWFFKITNYAEELLQDIDKLEHWPERVKIMQKNWIGKSEGLTLKFDVVDKKGNKIDEIKTFTTRPDTVYGITYLVLAAEHPKVLEWTQGTKYEKKVKEFLQKVKKQSIIERTAEGKEKNGLFLGKYFINPFTGEKCPLWMADYALYEYGTGAVMAVPTHDQRDFDFAKKYDLPMRIVISPQGHDLDPEKMSRAYTQDGVLANSDKFNGLQNRDAIEAISDYAEGNGWGERSTNYKLKDWLISRQRYWGTPIPIIYCDKCGTVPVPEENLPVLLPKDVKFTGSGNPLKTSQNFVNTTCPQCNSPAKRETDTMDTFVDSSWYFLRYCSPHFDQQPFDEKAAQYWMPVNQYIGGIEHACMHLIYARFFTKALRDLNLLNFDEPFTRLLCQGMVLKDGAKMSKSLGNVVDPKEIIDKYGSDTARLFILFASLPTKELEWSDKGVEGCHRFLQKTWGLTEEIQYKKDKETNNKDQYIINKTHQTIKNVTHHINNFELSLAIGSLMEFIKVIQKYKLSQKVHQKIYQQALEKLILLLSPFCPHLAEEMWQKTGHKGFVSLQDWPQFDPQKIDNQVEAAQEAVSQTISDIREVIELTGNQTPQRIKLIISAEWKYTFINQLQKKIGETRNPGEITKSLMQDPALKKHGQKINKLVSKIVKDPSKLPQAEITQDLEIKTLQESSNTLEKEFDTQIEIIKEEDSQEQKAQQSLPGKPAILLE